jgi:hypothetical protein
MSSQFEQWLSEVRNIMINKYGYQQDLQLDPKAYKDYFYEGLSPEDAIDEDMSYGDEDPDNL